MSHRIFLSHFLRERRQRVDGEEAGESQEEQRPSRRDQGSSQGSGYRTDPEAAPLPPWFVVVPFSLFL